MRALGRGRVDVESRAVADLALALEDRLDGALAVLLLPGGLGPGYSQAPAARTFTPASWARHSLS